MAENSTSQSATLPEDEFWASLHRGMHDEVTRSVPEDQLSSIIRDRNLDTKDAKLQAIANLLQQTVSTHQATYETSAQETCSALHALGMVQFERCDWAASIATDRRLLAAIEARRT